MANKSKIVGEMEIRVRDLCEKGYNPTHIGKQVGLATDTVKSWAKKNGFDLGSRTSSRLVDLESQVIGLLKEGKSRKQIQKTLKVHFTQVTDIAKKNGFEDTLRSRAISSLDKIISIEDANKRLPANSGKVIGFDQSQSKYVIQTADGYVYYKKSSKIKQGDPRGKSGTFLTIEGVSQQLKTLGYQYLEGFTLKRSPLKAIHLKCGNVRDTRLGCFYFQECATCSKTGVSKAELELLEWVRQFYPSACKYKFVERITRPKEIDVYIPELKLGIEYCGLWYHSEDILIENADENKHYKKMIQANKEGIRLITIFENEWLGRGDQVRSFLMSALKKNPTIIGARECEVREISAEYSNEFFDEYHIQGSGSKPKAAFGLFYNNELIAAINGGNHPQKSGNSDILYLNRMAFKAGITVSGGASKLFMSLLDFAKKNGFKQIISWSDNRWSEGAIYKQLGFEFDSQRKKGTGLSDGSIWPEVYYVIQGKPITRQAVKKFDGIDLSEIPTIYDCGKKRWIKTV